MLQFVPIASHLFTGHPRIAWLHLQSLRNHLRFYSKGFASTWVKKKKKIQSAEPTPNLSGNSPVLLTLLWLGELLQ